MHDRIVPLIFRITLSLLSAVMYSLSFPPHDLWWMAWVTLVPLYFAVNGQSPSRAAFYGACFGLASTLCLFSWLFALPGFRWFHAILGGSYLALYPALWSAAVSLLGRSPLPLSWTAAASWIVLDYLKCTTGFLSMPWGSLAQSQHPVPVLLQFASLAGEHGVTFTVVLANMAIARLLFRRAWRESAVAALFVLSVFLFGLHRLTEPENGVTHGVTVVQPCIWPGEQRRGGGNSPLLDRLERFTAAGVSGSTDLVVWPETALLGLQTDTAARKRLFSMTEQRGISLVTGTSERVKFCDYRQDGSGKGTTKAYNSAWLIEGGLLKGEPYRKTRLVPFGEYLPLGDTIRWPAWFVRGAFDTVAGNEQRIFEVNSRLRCGILICWENMFAGIARSERLKGAELLVNISNDGWFGRSAAARQHNGASVLRAIENGVPVVVASNCGPSEIIDSRGRVVTALPDTHAPGACGASVTTGAAPPYYARHGDQFLWSATFMLLAAIVMAWRGTRDMAMMEETKRTGGDNL